MESKNTHPSIENYHLFKKAENLKAKFPSTRAAINFYSGQLEEISISKKCSAFELLNLAEKDHCDELLLEVLSITRKLNFLLQINGK